MISLLDLLLGDHLKTLTQAWSTARKNAQAKDTCCEIPETECPPRCVSGIAWKFGRGAVPMATVVVRNDGTTPRTFAFAARPLAGLHGGGATFVVRPSTATLPPGADVQVEIQLTETGGLVAGQEYHSEFLFTGSWEQCVPIVARILPDPFEKRELEQSDAPPLFTSKTHHPTRPTPITWKAQRGVTAQAQVVLRNMGSGARTFNLSTSPLTGIDADTAKLSLSHTTVELAPRQHQLITVKLEDTGGLHPEQVYETHLLVDGFYEDRLPLSVAIESDATAYVRVTQGDPPTRIRAHQWYHHFQCTVPCVGHTPPIEN